MLLHARCAGTADQTVWLQLLSTSMCDTLESSDLQKVWKYLLIQVAWSPLQFPFLAFGPRDCYCKVPEYHLCRSLRAQGCW